MRLIVNYETFVDVAIKLDAETGDRTFIAYADSEDGFYKLGMTQGNKEWVSRVHTPSVSHNFLSNFLKNAIKVDDIQ